MKKSLLLLLLFLGGFFPKSFAQDSFSRLDSLLEQANVFAQERKFPDAKRRAFALLSDFKDSVSTAKIYNFIGDLCMKNANVCMQGNSLEQRYIYLFAYDMYEKANNQVGMKNAKERFPNLTNAFTCTPNPPTGSRVRVSCWVNEQTVLRFKE